MREEYTIDLVDIDFMYRRVLECQRQGYRLVAISATATDEGTEIIYSLSLDYKLENYKIFVKDGEDINSISDIFPSAMLFENEIKELFGVKIDSINVDFDNKFYRIKEETPFKRAKSVKVVPPKDDTASTDSKEAE